ncbi:substrate-binding domain-containing protein [Actinomadura roseirufa]|uniref:substrate-binding domain-containing protein n=1 Tax=Actinomadura roseirufa TaxID=2094049 RepID=UPI00104144A3|nr:substrate-binding domain-containing protein [Actinomadura roseirufa]
MFGRMCRITLAVGVAAMPSLVAMPALAEGAPAEPTVEVWSTGAGARRLDGQPDAAREAVRVGGDQAVEVRWKGFKPGSQVVITQCMSAFQVKNVHNTEIWTPPWDCAHQTRFIGTTGADGTGTSSYSLKSGRFASVVLSKDDVTETKNDKFECNSRVFSGKAEYSCSVVVSECEWDQPVAMAKPAGGSWTLVPRKPPAGSSDPAVGAASGGLFFKPASDGKPDVHEIPAPKPRKFPNPPEAQPLPPIKGQPVGAPIAGAGSVNTAVLLDGWLADVRRLAQPSDVDYTRGTSVFGAARLKAGFQSGFTSGADFAVTGMPFTQAEAGGNVVYAPVSLTGLAVANSAEYGGLGLNQARMSPDTLAFMLADGDGVTSGWWGDSSMNSPTMADNRGCGLPALPAGPILRSGQSAQNLVLSSWFGATLSKSRFGTFFVSEPGSSELLVKRASDIRGAENGSQTAYLIGTNYGKAVDPDPDDDFIPPKALEERQKRGYLGYTDVTEILAQRQRGVALPMSPLKNAAGNYVLPTKESILEAYSTMRHNADGTLTATFDKADKTGAYPLPMVQYVAVPRTSAQGANPLPIAKRKTLAAFIEYAVSDDAQKKAEELGGAQLPAELRKQARDVAAMLKRADPPKKGGGSSPSNGRPGSGGSNGGSGGGGGTIADPGGTGGTGGATTPSGTLPTPGATTPGAAAAPSLKPVANEGSVRGGKIPAASTIVPIVLILVLGAGALSAGGGWRGYLLWQSRMRRRAPRA